MNLRDYVIEYTLRAASGTATGGKPAKPVDIVQDAIDTWNELHQACPEIGQSDSAADRMKSAKVKKIPDSA